MQVNSPQLTSSNIGTVALSVTPAKLTNNGSDSTQLWTLIFDLHTSVKVHTFLYSFPLTSYALTHIPYLQCRRHCLFCLAVLLHLDHYPRKTPSANNSTCRDS